MLHITTQEEIAFLAEHKDVATAEATPAHLTLVAPDCYERLGTLAQLNPPVRDAAHRDGLWQGIADGVIDSVGSDHSPHTREEKAHALSQDPFRHDRRADAGSGDARPRQRRPAVAGALGRSHQRGTCAHLFGIARKGRIAAGYDADFTVVDLEAARNHYRRLDRLALRLDAVRTASTVTGWPVGTFVRGRKVMWQGELVTPSQGEAVRFVETLEPA